MTLKVLKLKVDYRISDRFEGAFGRIKHFVNKELFSSVEFRLSNNTIVKARFDSIRQIDELHSKVYFNLDFIKLV